MTVDSRGPLLSWRRHGWVLLLAAAALARSLAFAAAIPAYRSSDEPWHLDHARALSEGTLPVLGRTLADPAIVADHRAVAEREGLPAHGLDADEVVSREAFQPPLAYALPAAGYAIADGPRAALRWFRWLDALWGAVAVGLVVVVARRAMPGRTGAAVVGALVAVTLPSLIAVTATANNDALLVVVSLGVLAGAASIARGDAGRRTGVLTGAGVAVASFVKAGGLLLVVPLAVAWIVRPGPRDDRLRSAAWSIGTAGALSAPWLVRNVVVYGSPLGTAAFTSFDPQPGTAIGGWGLLLGGRPDHPLADPFWPELWRTTVGVFGWADQRLPGWLYGLALAATVAGVARAVVWFRGRTVTSGEGAPTREGSEGAPAVAADGAERRAALVLVSLLPALLAATVWFAFTVDYQPQGRYLLPGVLAAAVVVGAGLPRVGIGAAAATGAVLLGGAAWTVLGAYA